MLVAGCSHTADRRLVLADTLMWTRPDSSLAILSHINNDSLTSDEDKAYHALLLTQAQFRCNIPLTSDTLISKAVDYYNDNHNREHYTRALLYKGGAYEDMGKPVEAIKWYKQAEDNADSTDYRNLAQLNMRMGMLYYNNFASNNLDLDKFRKATYYYDKLGDKYNVQLSVLYSGNVYRLSNSIEANKCYDKVEALSIELKDSANLYSVFINKALLYLKDSLYNKSKDCMLRAFSLPSNYVENYHFLIISQAYAKLNNVDSAEYFLRKVDFKQCTPYDSVMLYKTLKEISIANGDYVKANQFEKTYYHLSDSLEHNNERYSLAKFEADFNNDNSVSKSKRISSLNHINYILIVLFFIILIFFLFYHNRKKKNYLKLISDLRNENFSKYEKLKRNISEFDDNLGEIMSSKLESFEGIMSGAYSEQQDSLKKEVAHKISSIDDTDSKFWNGLYEYLNYKHNGVMGIILEQFPQLSTADTNFLALMCCGFSDAAIAVCKRYRNTASVRSKRRQIRNKMGIEGSLGDFIKNMTE